MAIAEIYVTLKPALLDVQGATVLKSLHQLGHGHAADVRIGKYITVAFDDGVPAAEMQTHLDAMCRELLANPVIEDYRISLNGSTPVPAPANGVRGAARPVIVAGDEVPHPAAARESGASTGAAVSAATISAPQEVPAAPAAPLTPVTVAPPVAAAPAEVSTATAAATAATTIADPFAVSYAAYSSMTADQQLDLQGLAWQKHGAWIENELASRAAVWILCVGADVVESGDTLESYPSDERLDTLGTANDLVPWVFTRAPQD